MCLKLPNLVWMVIVVVSTVDCPAQVKPEASLPRKNVSESTFILADGRIRFAAPAGFTALSSSELATKFPRTRAPRHAVGNNSRTTTIAYDLSDEPAGSTDLESGRKVMAESFEQQVPDLKWLLNTVDRVGERDWVHLEFTAPVLDGPIHCIMLMSVFDARILIFNFNSTEKEFPTVRRALHASMASISVKQ
jgi:hypothetical protein